MTRINESTTSALLVSDHPKANADAEIPLRNRSRPIKVLHIEDDPAVSKSVARVLRLSGLEVTSATTREEAIEQVAVHGLRPDVILTDFHLGKGTTSESLVAELAARLNWKPPTILLTGSQALSPPGALGFADRVLSKPVDIPDLLRDITELHLQQAGGGARSET